LYNIVGPKVYEKPSPEDAARYEAVDPGLADDWEDLHWRALKTGGYTNDRERPGGDWGGYRLPTGITAPAKAYYRGMVDCIRDGRYSTVLELYELLLKDVEVDSFVSSLGLHSANGTK
jgi:hypothetical protein